jgi:hypothetical protein
MTRRSKAEWLTLIEEHQNSGLSAAEFCRRNQLDPKCFSLRRRELCKPKPAFIEVAPRADMSADVRVRVIELTVPLTDLGSVLALLG